MAQKNIDIKNKLDELSKTEKGLNELVQINVSGISLFDFVTALSNEHKVNISVEKTLNQSIINNFYNVQVKDVFYFLINEYDIDVQFLGRIIVFKKKVIKEKPKKLKKAKEIDITFNKKKELSLNLKRDTLFQVTKKITNLTGENIIVDPKLKNKLVTCYILNKSFNDVLQMLSQSNDLSFSKDKKGFYLINPAERKAQGNVKRKTKRNETKNNKVDRNNNNLIINLNNDNSIDVTADQIPVIDVIYNTGLKLNEDYFLYSDIPENLKTSFTIKKSSFEEVLEHILKGTRYTFKKEKEYYLIGEKNKEGLRTTELIQMKNRTIENVIQSIPSKISSELEIKEFIELNGLVVSGHHSAVNELKLFLLQIDKNVPIIQIEVIIFQHEKSHSVQTGLQAGFSDSSQTTSLVSSFPTTNVNLESSTINKLIDAFNGLGIINLGSVTSSFYASLSALEDNAIIKIESTPKIATLNGHEASLKIGATDYYFEQTNTLLTNTVSSDVLQSGTWKPTEANLSLNIKPFVSKDENVTLNITVEKSAFTGRVGETAPPNKVTQQFESLIRVKNGDMVLLGGLDEVEKNDSGTGTPFLSRIPIIKWFFSSKIKEKSKKKLHILIKPTVYY